MDVSMLSIIVAFILQTLDIQIFGADDIVFVYVYPGKLMDEIGYLVIDPILSLIQLI